MYTTLTRSNMTIPEVAKFTKKARTLLPGYLFIGVDKETGLYQIKYVRLRGLENIRTKAA